jgi:hypothetical protein
VFFDGWLVCCSKWFVKCLAAWLITSVIKSLDWFVLRHTHARTHANTPHYVTVTFSEVRRKSNLAQGTTECAYGQTYRRREKSPAEMENPAHCTLVGPSMTAMPAVLSPSSILPPSSSHCASIPARKNSACV